MLNYQQTKKSLESTCKVQKHEQQSKIRREHKDRMPVKENKRATGGSD